MSDEQRRVLGEDGRYELVEELGSGGMGTVYRAWEPALQRFVAIKVLQREDAEVAARFAHEAARQARVEHDHVCPVYDVGSDGGRPYIVMQLIVGRSLLDAAAELSLEETVRLVQRVADAVHAANRLGLIHRDLKPGNILVERAESGALKPYVLDFGLAQDQRGESLTRTGQIMGTPQYMAPEQARGETHRLDRRTDVYSLGAVLYRLLAGQPPHAGLTEYEVLVHVAEEDAQPLSSVAPHVPADLATIVMKCLEREPDRRYDSALALAEDLGRFLDGEPILARAPSLTYLLSKKLRKYRRETAIAATALALIAVLVGMWLRTRWREAERATLAQRFGQRAEQLEGFLRFAAVRPLHDTGPERAVIRERMRAIESEMTGLGGLAEGPGHFALGRGYLALGELEAARRHLQRAWDAGATSPEVAFALGRALGGLYKAGREAAQMIRLPELRRERLELLEATYRRPALELLRRSRGAATVVPAYGEGLIALYDERFEDALAKAREALAVAPWLYEAIVLEGDAQMAIGGELQERGELTAALAAYESAGRAYHAAAEVARSEVAVYRGLNLRWVKVIEIETIRGGDIGEAFTRALDAIDRALTVEPGSAVLHVRRGITFHRRADFDVRRGRDPTSALDRVIACGRRAIELDEALVTAYHTVGTALLYRAFAVEMPHGRDPRPSLDQAAEALRQGLEREPGFVGSRANLGTVYAVRAEYAIAHGLDPMNDLTTAIDSFEEVLDGQPEIPALLNNLGNIYYRRGQYVAAHGGDPRADHERAIDVCRRAVAVNPALPQPRNLLGANLSALAAWELDHGRDPGPLVDRAIVAFNDALAANPRYAFALSNLGEAGTLVARYAWLTAGDPSAWIERAEEWLRRAVAINPSGAAELWSNLAATLHLRALVTLDAGGDAAQSLAAARDALDYAIGIDPRGVVTHVRRAEVEVTEARRAAASGGSPGPSLERAWRAVTRAVEINPRDPRVWVAEAWVARWRCGLTPPACPAVVAPGAEAAARALAIDPEDARARALQGLLELQRAALEDEPAARLAAVAAGRAAVAAAVAANPLLARELVIPKQG